MSANFQNIKAGALYARRIIDLVRLKSLRVGDIVDLPVVYTEYWDAHSSEFQTLLNRNGMYLSDEGGDIWKLRNL
jgi:hypothetical protein